MTLTKLCIRVLSLTVGSLSLAALAGAAPTGTGGEPPAKLKKQISVMEKILDETLVDSKNVLVANHHVTRGVYLPEFGVLFTLEASVLSPDNDGWWKNFDFSKFRVETEDGKTVVHFDDEDNDSDKDKSDKDAKKAEKRELTKKEILKARQEGYEKGKNELVTALVDYGETLNGLRDDQWVGVAAFFDDDDFFGEPQADTVILKAKMGDLRAHSAGRVSDQEMQSRVMVEEY